MQLNRDLILMLIKKIKAVADKEDHEDEFADPNYDIRARLESKKTPEWRAMMGSVGALNSIQVAELHTLMLIGRGDLEPIDWSASVARLTPHDKDESLGYMLDKRHLVKYLLAGLGRIDDFK